MAVSAIGIACVGEDSGRVPVELFNSVDTSAAAAWVVSHSAIAAGQAGAAFLTALIGVVVVGVVVFAVNVVALISAARRRQWPPGHSKWAWMLAITAAFVISIVLPGFCVWLGLVVPAVYWFATRRSATATNPSAAWTASVPGHRRKM